MCGPPASAAVFFPHLAAILFLAACLIASADILDDVTRQQPGRTMRHSSGLFDPESNADAYHLAAGECRTIAELAGPGEIRHIWFTIAGDRRYSRLLVLRIYWDGADVPSIETPIGDFFAAGNGMRVNVSTTPIEVTSYGRALNTFWHMPFRKQARVEMVNQSKNRLTVYCQINWLQLPALPDSALYFHARYHQEFPVKPFSPYTIFEGEGEGQYVGTVLSSQNSLGSWFGEADDRFYIDGEETPSLVGTGTEDFFTDAWNLRLFSNPNAGVTICEPKGVDCRMTLYRWHLHAPVIFRKSLKVEIERRSFVDIVDPATGRTTQYDFVHRPDFFSSVAFWYQKGVAKRFSALPPAEQRLNPEIWVEVKEMTNQVRCAPGLRPVVRSNRTCFGKTMFFLENQQVGHWLEVPVDIPDEAQYSISCFQLLFPEYGIWKVTLDSGGTNRVLDAALDFYDPYVSLKENWPESIVYGTVREAKLGVLRLNPGRYTLRFECVGSNPLARVKKTGQPGLSLAMDAISFRKLPWDHTDQWMTNYLAEEKRLNAQRETTARETVAQLAAAAQRFSKDLGQPPAALDELLVRPQRLATQTGNWPYFASPRIPLDPWGQPYVYVQPGRFNPDGFDVYSVRGHSRDPSGWIGNWEMPYRIPGAVEGESLTVAARSEGVTAIVQKIATETIPSTSGGALLFVRLGREGAWAEFALPKTLPPGRHSVTLYAATARDYGIVQWSLDGKPLGGRVDGYTPSLQRRAVAAGEITLGTGERRLRVQAVGRNPESSGHYAGLDAIAFKPLP